jgi:hypothetical protein
MQIDSNDLNNWGGDFISHHINSHVHAMPDRPRIVIVVLTWGSESDILHADILRPFSPNHFSTQGLKALGRPLRIAYLGFDSTDSPDLYRFLLETPKLQVDEMVHYIDGVAVFRSDRVVEVPYDSEVA